MRHSASSLFGHGNDDAIMKNFRLIQKNLGIEPILNEIARWPEAWDLQTGRQKITVQREARTIPIRGLRKSKIRDRPRRDVHESRFTTISHRFPQTIRFLCSWAERFDSELARAKLVHLAPDHRIYPHRDRGDYYARRNRYHLVLQSEGSWMRCGQEDLHMKAGELWWFDNKEIHEAHNDGRRDRIHLIFDLEPRNDVLGHPTSSLGNRGVVPSDDLDASESMSHVVHPRGPSITSREFSFSPCDSDDDSSTHTTRPETPQEESHDDVNEPIRQ